MIRPMALIALLFLPACATITQGSTDTVTVDTRPPGAVCTITQNGQTVAVINPTPGSMVVPKSKNDLAVDCEKDGFNRSAGLLASEFEAMTFGNIIFGGVVGVAVDAASGALNEYPPIITLTLQPEEFRNPEERDQFFDKQRDEFKREYDATVARIAERCKEDANCKNQLAMAADAREARLREIEARRLAARVAA